MANIALFEHMEEHAPARINTIGTYDLEMALREGLKDFMAKPSHVIFLCIIYPIVGLIIGRATIGSNLLPLLFPLMAGFTLVGPFAAIGLYEFSRRREQGLEPTWTDAIQVVRSQSFGSILTLGIGLLVLFGIWIAAANAIYAMTIGGEGPASFGAFVHDVFLTPAGWAMIVLGNIVGFAFAAVVLTISVVAFPMLLDRHVGVATAVQTSIAVVRANPRTMAIWGLIVAFGLLLGSLPLFVGLAIVMPVLGHATWHLYRAVIEPERTIR
jgi:uncharacterized membrane protein